MKAASGGGIDRTGNFSFHERYYVIAPAGIRIGDRIEKKSGVRVERLMENILCATQLAEPAQEHDADPVGDIAHYREVVADEQISQASSHTMRAGSAAIARAMPILWRCPPENWWG